MRINRDYYLNDLISKQNNGLIKVITGLRRCGKSYLLFSMYRDYLIDSGVPAGNIITFAFDTDEDIDLLDGYYPDEETRIWDKNKKTFVVNSKKFRAFIKDRTDADNQYYILLDEIQILDNFVGTLNGFLRHANFDTYVTGSNSKMLSKDIITEFRGRGDQISMTSLSFKEFFDAVDMDFEDAYEAYSYYGGMPYLINLKSDNEKREYLKRLFTEVYIKDIVDRNNISDEDSFTRLMEIVASSIGALTNPTKLEKTFKSNQVSYSHNTIKKHLDYVRDAFLLDEALRYDVKGKSYIGSNSKLYFKDIGLRNALLNFRQQEPTHIMENIIYNELVRGGFNVDVGTVEIIEKNDKGNSVRKQVEVDFVCSTALNKYYIQSAFSIAASEKMIQETRSLKSIPDSFKKVIITKDRTKPWRTDEGILIISLKDFLLDIGSLDL